MKLYQYISLVIMLLATNGYAQCDVKAKTLFSCLTAKGKQIQLCDSGKNIEYSFGKPGGKPEKFIKVPRGKATTTQWDGVGRSMIYAVDVPTGDTVYSIYVSADRVEAKVESGVSVTVKGKYLTSVICGEGNIINNLEGIDLKPTE